MIRSSPKTPRSLEARNDCDGTVQALSRALQLLELLGDDTDGYRLVDLADRSGLAPSTVHRLLTTLQQHRFVQFERESNLWHVGARCFSVGATFARRRRIHDLALPVMRRLRDLTRASVNLGLADDDDILFVGQVKGPTANEAIAELGQRIPLHGAAIGQAILAEWPEADVQRYLRTRGLPRLTRNTITRPSRLYVALAAVRSTGYAVDDEQNAPGLRCIAAAIRDEHGRPFAALSVAGPSHCLPVDAFAAIGDRIRAASDEVSTGFGGRGTRAANSATACG